MNPHAPNKTTIETDVLIIGGGLAGCNAAIGAAEQGARVVVLDKGRIERTGDIAGGVDHFMAYLEEGEPWDTAEAYLEYVGRIARGAIDLKITEAVFCRGLKAVHRENGQNREPPHPASDRQVLPHEVHGTTRPLLYQLQRQKVEAARWARKSGGSAATCWTGP